MAETVACSAAISRLCAIGRSPAQVVAWRGQQALHEEQLAAQATAWYRHMGTLPAGQPVAVYFHDSFSAAAALLGAWYARRTVILPADAQSETVRRLQDELHASLIGDFAGGAREPAMAAQNLPPLQPTLDPEQPALIVFTSGSTGTPVALNKTLRQLLTEVAVQQELWGERLRGCTVVATVSHQHIYGLLFRLLLPLVQGIPFLAERLEYPEEVMGALQQHASALVSSPAFLKRLPGGEAWPAHPAVVFSSGGPLLPEAALRAETRLQTAVIEIYGSSETGGIAWRRQSQGPVWTVLPHVDTALDEGLLRVRSPWTQAQDWHQTSDRARLEADGFELEGRADRLVKIEEKRVSLDGIEACLLARTEVDEARVVLLSGERARLGAVIVLSAAGRLALERDGKRALNDRLREHLLHHVERVALPRYWRYVPALPVNALGKITQAALQALFDQAGGRYPRVLSRLEADLRVQLELAAEISLPWFEGHFPGLPILPGVAMLDWAEYFARQQFALPPDLLRMDVIKFQKVIVPGTQVRLELEWQPERSAVAFRATSSAGPHASGRLIFGDEHAA